MGQKSSLYRTIEILRLLDEGKTLCVSNLAVGYEVSERTIRRDFELIRELFGDFMSKEGECYRAYKKVLLEEVLSATDLMTLANIVNLFGVTEMESSISDETRALVNRSLSVYDFKSRPFENMRNLEIVKKLEHAIKYGKEVKLQYRSVRGNHWTLFHPYKILFVNENFYLVGENHSKKFFEFRRISRVIDVVDTQKSFYQDREIVAFIARIQTPWAAFGNDEILVRLRADESIRRYFEFKKYLPSQTVAGEFDNGDIEVHYRVTSLQEIEELVIKWLPKIEVLAPRGLEKKVRKTLKRKLEALKPG